MKHTILSKWFAPFFATVCLVFSTSSVFAAETAAPQAAEQVTTPQVTKVADEAMVNINTATAVELQQKLNGIGAKKAQAIVDYREQNGKFSSVEQLADVSGIGAATVDKNRILIKL